jgi:hypothetical protein
MATAPSAPALASELIGACEAAWRAIQRQHPDVPDVVIVLGTGVERGRLVKLGHWWGGRWIADGNVRGEVLLAGEALHLPPEAVFEVLLHEAAHGLNAARGVKDASRGGRYHNVRFKHTAEELGLVVEQMRPYGWARTSIGSIAQERYDPEIGRISDAMRIARRLGADVSLGTDDQVGDSEQAERDATSRAGDRQQAALCGCGRRMRMAPSVLAQGPVLCGVCGEQFSVGKTVALERESLAEAHGEPNPEGPAQRDSVDERRDRESFFEPPADSRTAALYAERDRDALTTIQREGLAALIELGATTNGALLLTEAGAWYAARRSGVDAPLLGTNDAEVDDANRAARAMLKLVGTLQGPAADVCGRELQIGELVSVGAADTRFVDVDGRDLPPTGVFGIVEATDRVRGEVTIDFAISGRRTIAITSPAAASLAYGYAERRKSSDAGLVDVHLPHERWEPQQLAPEIGLAP